MIKFIGGLDSRTRTLKGPQVAMLDHHFIVVGTQYGHIHTTGGDIRTWRSYSGARRFLRRYLEEGWNQ